MARHRLGRFVSALLVAAVFASAVRVAISGETTGPAAPPADHAEKMRSGLELFKEHVAALLKTHCVKCHGGQKTEGDFDLTTREALLKGGADGAAVVVGKAAESRIYALVAHADEPHMPYEEPKLPDAAIAQLAAWIDSGAPYDGPLVEKAPVPKGHATVSDEDRQFWSFRPLSSDAPPVVQNQAWCQTPIDRFILARLEAQGLAPNVPVERRKLIRRAYFDLLGLPPSPDEIDRFVNDPDPQAYEKLIDRLLENPHYGERWGRHWLDLARFAESHGYEQDYDRPSAYHFRDFVIQALNADMPYDQFVRLQIAGDELEPENPLAMMATGYLAAGTHATQITANQVEKERYDELDDMAATIGTSLLGLTIGCARCHDHKYDPIPQTDYYRLLSTFTTTVRSEIDLDLHPERYAQAKAQFDREHAPLSAALESFEREELPGRLQRWLETDPKPPQPKWLLLDSATIKSDAGATFASQPDGSFLASGNNPQSDTYTVTARTPLAGITAVRLEALADPSLPKGGPGRAENGNFALSGLRLSAAPIKPDSEPGDGAVELKLVDAKATYQQDGLPVAAAVDDDKTSAWAVDGQIGKDQAALFELESPIAFEAGAVLTFQLKFENNSAHQLGRLRLSVATAPRPVALDGDAAPHDLVIELGRILATPAAGRSDDQRATLLRWFRTTDPDWQRLNQAVGQHLAVAPKPELAKVLVSSEGLPAIRLHTQGADFFEQTYFLKRGDLRQKLEPATQSFLQVLITAPEREEHWRRDPPPGWRTSFRRASLAGWVTDPQYGAGHLLARVIVNRLWQHHLGRGIVATPSDFGAQGERPTHPELLDWLAGELLRHDWRLKPIHKSIMTSSVYMQGIESDEGRAALDRDNKLFWRRSLSRLEAEAIRDAMLSISGLLDERMFGPGTLDEAHLRRSIYFTIKRSQLIPILMLFDAPDSLQGMGLRPSTTVAPQALLVLNNPQVQRDASAFAQRLLPSYASSAQEAIRQGYRLALGREPDPEELQLIAPFLERQIESYRSAGKPQPAERGLTDFCRSLLGMNEFVYVE